jgi:hypothetical protein
MDEPDTMLCERCSSRAVVVRITRMDEAIWPRSAARRGWSCALIKCPHCGEVEQCVAPPGDAELGT